MTRGSLQGGLHHRQRAIVSGMGGGGGHSKHNSTLFSSNAIAVSHNNRAFDSLSNFDSNGGAEPLKTHTKYDTHWKKTPFNEYRANVQIQREETSRNDE